MPSATRYHEVPAEGDSEKGETGYFLTETQQTTESHQNHQQLYRRNSRSFPALGFIAAFCLGSLSTATIGYFQSGIQTSTFGLYEKGWIEEKLIPPESIQIEQVRFKSPVDFEMDGHEFLVVEPDEKIYVGDSWDEIDRNWEELLWGRYFSISEDEAKSLWPDKYLEYVDPIKSGWTGGFDVFHQLHCLNQIRQALHRDIYPEVPIHGAVHTEHCINHLRQAIMCWGTTTVIPTKYFPGYRSTYVVTDAVHTCRAFDPIRELTKERFNGSLSVARPSGWVDTEENAF
ncbi:hypothetical protein N0V82_000408 [Gnomoniopsis sp. IMI 355080]|nr:hypothetical protein N0V82_000408 [Gnomoniopsis sp. IMI 355080]